MIKYLCSLNNIDDTCAGWKDYYAGSTASSWEINEMQRLQETELSADSSDSWTNSQSFPARRCRLQLSKPPLLFAPPIQRSHQSPSDQYLVHIVPYLPFSMPHLPPAFLQLLLLLIILACCMLNFNLRWDHKYFSPQFCELRSYIIGIYL